MLVYIFLKGYGSNRPGLETPACFHNKGGCIPHLALRYLAALLLLFLPFTAKFINRLGYWCNGSMLTLKLLL